MYTLGESESSFSDETDETAEEQDTSTDSYSKNKAPPTYYLSEVLRKRNVAEVSKNSDCPTNSDSTGHDKANEELILTHGVNKGWPCIENINNPRKFFLTKFESLVNMIGELDQSHMLIELKRFEKYHDEVVESITRSSNRGSTKIGETILFPFPEPTSKKLKTSGGTLPYKLAEYGGAKKKKIYNQNSISIKGTIKSFE